jgi:hypothetical protein
MALVAILVLSLPGLVLFVLTVLGKEGAVNAWMQDRLRLTFHIPIAWWASLVMLLVPPAIILLYFLKLKRRPLQVPSTFLWKKSIEDLHVNSLFQWLRENVLLLLQVLTVLALIYAIMAFHLHGKIGEGKHYILMIDNSASMSATDVKPSRLHQAKDEAQKVIDSHSDNDVGMVVVFNSSAETLQSFTTDRGLLRLAVEKVAQTQRTTRIDEALSFADSLANPTRSTENEASRPAGEEPGKERTYVPAEGIPTELHIFSDGRFPEVPDFALGNLGVEFHAIGVPGADAVDNVGLVTLSALRDEREPGKIQVLARVLNFRAKSAQTKVRLEVRVNGELQSVYEKPENELLTLSPRTVAPAQEGKANSADADVPGEGTIVFDLNDVDERANVVLHAELLNIKDDFPLDNEAWLVIGVVRKARVLIITPGNRILQAFFDHEATTKVANVQYLEPADLQSEDKYRRPALDGAFDFVVFDRCRPAQEQDLPHGNTFFIDELPPPWSKNELPKLEAPHIRGWMSKHPLLRYLTGLQDIGVTDAFQFNLRDPRVPPRTPRLIESDKDTVLMFSLSRQSFTDLVMTFPLINNEGKWTTDWPLRPSFPLFLRNLLYTFGNVGDSAGEPNIQPGDTKVLRPDTAVRHIEVTDPAGKTETLERGTRADFSYGKTDQVGIYQVKWGEKTTRPFAVNLLDADESNLQPRTQVSIGAEQIMAGETHGRPREVWKWVVLAGLILLLLEWYIYNRRVYI